MTATRPGPPELGDGAATAPGEPSPAPDDTETPERLRGVLQLVGSVVAPTSLLTALLFYFGWAYSAKFFGYFGLDVSLVGLTAQDYLTQSVQALFVPLAVSLSVGLLLFWVQARLRTRLFVGPDARRRLQIAALASAIVGVSLLAVGMAGIFVVEGTARLSLRYPLSFGAGAVLLAVASRLHARVEGPVGVGARSRSTALLELTAAFFVVALSVFWAATNYAADVGVTKARNFENQFRSRPEAILYSKDPLYLEAPGVRETSCAQPAGGYRFRYQGLRLMIRSGGQYFLLPASWSRSDGMAIVVPESEAVRLQFAVHAGGRRAASPAITCPSPPPPS